MKEIEIIRQIRDYLKTVNNCFFWKEHGGMYGTQGLPDIIACVKGKFIAFEVKTATGKTTALQFATIGQILKAGGTAAVVRSAEDVKQIIQNLR